MLLSRESESREQRLTSLPVWGMAAVAAKSIGFVSSRLELKSGFQHFLPADSGLSLFISAMRLLVPFSKGCLEG